MIRTEQILNAKFTPVSKGTYSADEVDAFLKVVAESYDALGNEKAELLKKISILADKIESYRNDEEAIKLALLDAHRMAETITKNAKIKSDTLIGDAETRSQLIVDGANRQSAKLIDDAREQAKELVENARNAVNSLTERAQSETDATIAAANKKAAEIVEAANAEGEAVISDSKKLYEYYSAEVTRLQATAEEFKSAMAALCTEQLSLLSAVPEIDAASDEEVVLHEEATEEVIKAEADAEEAVEFESELPFGQSLMDEIESEIAAIEESVAPVTELVEEYEAPDAEEEPDAEEADAEEVEEPVVYVPEEPEAAEEEIPGQSEEQEADDLFSLIDDMDLSDITLPESIPSSIDDLVPDISTAAQDSSSEQPATDSDFVLDDGTDDEEDGEDDEDVFEGFKIDLDSIGEDDGEDDEDDDITSLFDSMFDD